MFNELDGTVHIVEHVHHHLPFALLLLFSVDERRCAEGEHNGKRGGDEGHQQILQPWPPHNTRDIGSVRSQFVAFCPKSHNQKFKRQKYIFIVSQIYVSRRSHE